MNLLLQVGIGSQRRRILTFTAVVSCLAAVAQAQNNCVAPPAGLVGWWRAEGNAADFVGGNNGIVSNVTYIRGEVGQAFNFDGVTSTVTIPASSSLNVESLTIEAWIFPSDIDHPRPIVEYGAATGVGYVGLWYGTQGYSSQVPGAVQGWVSGTNNAFLGVFSSSGPITSNQWNHVAMTFDYGFQALILYVNGVAVVARTSTVPVLPATSVPLNFGYRPPGSSLQLGGVRHLGGLDEVSVYDRALSAAEIQAIYNAGTNGKCAGPVPPEVLAQPASQSVLVGANVSFAVVAGGSPPLSYQWEKDGTPMSGATSNTLVLRNVQLRDSGAYSVLVSNAAGKVTSSNAVLTVSTAPPCTPTPSGLVSWWQAEGNAVDLVGGNNGVVSNVTYTRGEVGQAFNFDGATSTVTIPASSSLTVRNLTIEGWIFPPDIDNPRPIVEYGAATGLGYVGLWYGTQGYSSQVPGAVQGWVGGTNNAFLVVYSSAGPVISNQWNHVAMTFDYTSQDLILYVNGVAVAQQTSSVPILPATSFPLNLGYRPPGSSFQLAGARHLGGLDELSVYDRALSGPEIQAIYNAGTSGKCIGSVAPTIGAPLASQSAQVGDNVNFAVQAAGSVPLSYQWQFNGTPISGATSNTLSLNSVSLSSAGSYLVVVTNVAGSATSTVAVLTVTLPPASVQVGTATAGTDGTVTVPINLLANGNENALGFTLDFDTNLLTNASVTLGSGGAAASLLSNQNQAAAGQLGVAVAMAPGAAFAAGTQQLVVVSFASPIITTQQTTMIGFGDVPTKRLVSDVSGHPVSATFVPGTVTLPPSQMEGDVYPRPNGDQELTVSDWVLVGRYVAALDAPTNGLEFQKADCAPRDTLGDGKLTVSDWVQAGRYAVGLDPMTRAGGPTSPVPNVVPATQGSSTRRRTSSEPRQMRIINPTLMPGQIGTVTIALEAQGNENALAFSLSFDPARLVFAGATAGDATTGALLNVNARQASQGRVGCALALKTGQSFPAGRKQLINVGFRATALASGNTTISFGDQPVLREICDATAQVLPADYLNGSIAVNPLPALRIASSWTSITLTWPVSANGFVLQETSDPTLAPATWTTITAAPAIVNNQNVVSLPLRATEKFYRLATK
jgi:hypothetical protein